MGLGHPNSLLKDRMMVKIVVSGRINSLKVQDLMVVKIGAEW